MIPEYEYRSRLQERREHGGKEFPFNIYPCTIPLDFPYVQVHWHEEMEIISVKKGRGVVTADRQTVTVEAGEAVAVFPGQLHGISVREGESVEYENIIFRPQMLMASGGDLCTAEFLLPLTEQAPADPVHMRPGRDGWEDFSLAVSRLDRLCGEKAYAYELGVKGVLFELLRTIFQEWKPKRGSRPEKSREKIKGLLDFVEEHYGEKITVEDAAGICCYSSSHFMKYFRQYMGVPFVEYLNSYRLFQASVMLLSGADSVTAVAQSCGFDNLSYFNRLFRKKYGCTPGEYRKKGERQTERAKIL